MGCPKVFSGIRVNDGTCRVTIMREGYWVNYLNELYARALALTAAKKAEQDAFEQSALLPIDDLAFFADEG